VHFERITFTNADGVTLAARIDLPISGRPTAYAVFAHCFTCTKNLNAVGNITRELASEGIATLRFDFTGLGESEGDFSETNFSTNLSDLHAAVDWLAENRAAPQLLIGHSLGGAAVLAVASERPEVLAVTVIGSPAAPSHIRRHLVGAVDAIERDGQAPVLLGGSEFVVSKQFLDDIDGHTLQECTASLGAALLVMHSPIDNTVGVDSAAEIFGWARHPKSYVSLDDADHLLSDPEDATYVGQVIASWAERYVQPDQKHSLQPDLAAGETESVTWVRIGNDGYRTEIIANGFPMVADEPESVGGTNTGPNPYDFVLAGLGACTAITLRMYATRKGWPLDSVDVRLTHAKVHARDSEHTESMTGTIDHIGREITLSGSLDDEQKARLMDIADRCPVHRSLHGEVAIITNLGA
jgi:putative redox protein